MAKVMRGKPVADGICEGLVPRIERLRSLGVAPRLAVLRVGAREDDLSYERGIEKRFGTLGLETSTSTLGEGCTQDELAAAIEAVNRDASVHGCLILRPLPDGLDEEAACNALDPSKDLDGITPGSLYGVFANRAVGFPPCTAEACVRMLDHYGCGLDGANVAVVGRSLVIGLPVAMMLQARNATVTMCHTHTRDLAAICRAADVVVAAAGRAGTVGECHVREGHHVVDVGINWSEEAGKLVGDVDFEAVEPVAGSITPVPGGVGAVTTAVLAAHLVEAAERLVEHGA